jgi:hypothetical protein
MEAQKDVLRKYGVPLNKWLKRFNMYNYEQEGDG